MATSTPPPPSKATLPPTSARAKRLATLSINIIGQMWLGFHITMRDGERVLRSIMQDFYYDDRKIKILFLTKSDTDKDFAFITLTTKEARNNILNNGLTYHSKHLKVSITKDKDTNHPSELRISSTLVAMALTIPRF